MTNTTLSTKALFKLIFTPLFLCILILPGIGFAGSSVKASVTINVGDPGGTALAVINEAEKLNGYFTLHADDHVSINVPVKHVTGFLSFVEKKGIVTGKKYDAEDFSTQLILKKTTLNAREKMLEQYIKVLEGAGNKKIVTVETEVVKLAEKIEDIKGHIRFLEHCTAYAKIDVFFSYHDRTMPTAKKESSFAWLNTMNLQDMIWDFRNE